MKKLLMMLLILNISGCFNSPERPQPYSKPIIDLRFCDDANGEARACMTEYDLMKLKQYISDLELRCGD